MLPASTSKDTSSLCQHHTTHLSNQDGWHIQVPLAGLWCPTPSDQQDIWRANSIWFTLVSQKCMDLSLSDTTAHSFTAVCARMSHIDTEESKQHSRGTQDLCTRAAVTLCHFPEVFRVFYLSAWLWLSKQKRQMKINEKYLWGHWNGHQLQNKLIKMHPIYVPFRWLLVCNLSHSASQFQGMS